MKNEENQGEAFGQMFLLAADLIFGNGTNSPLIKTKRKTESGEKKDSENKKRKVNHETCDVPGGKSAPAK